MLTMNGDTVLRDNAQIGQIMPDSIEGTWRFFPSGTQNLSGADMTWLLIVINAREIGA